LRHHQSKYHQTLLQRRLKMWTRHKEVQFNIADQPEELQVHLCKTFSLFYIKRGPVGFNTHMTSLANKCANTQQLHNRKMNHRFSLRFIMH
jgi:hypothetical protein